MSLSIIQIRRFKQGIIIVLIATFLGFLYAVFSDGFKEVYPFINAGIGGFLAGLAVAVLEFGLFSGRVRKKKFFYILLLRILLYIFLLTSLFLNVIIISRMIRLEQTYAEVISDDAFHHYLFKEDFPILLIYAMALAIVVNFTRMISRKLGQGMLLSFILGTYRTPVSQERIVMFLKLENSHEISRQLGSMDFHRFLNEFFHDITDSIILYKGIIEEYVEDLIVVTWGMKKGRNHANCIRTYFQIIEDLESKNEDYFSKFGVIPKPYAAFHAGTLIRYEIGDVKSEIVFIGDTMNTVARILEKCSEQGANVLVSAQLSHQLELPKIYTAKSMGKVKLRGMGEELELYQIGEIIHENVPEK